MVDQDLGIGFQTVVGIEPKVAREELVHVRQVEVFDGERLVEGPLRRQNGEARVEGRRGLVGDDRLEGGTVLDEREVGARGRVVLDLACGAGRWLLPLERAGARAIGADLSWPLLQRAAELRRQQQAAD